MTATDGLSRDLPALRIRSALLRIVGVLELGKKGALALRQLQAGGFRKERFEEDKLRMLRGIFYPEFAGVMFRGGGASNLEFAAQTLGRPLDFTVEVESRLGARVVRGTYRFTRSELMLFSEPALGVFAIDVEVPAGSKLDWLSTAIVQLRGFGSRALDDSKSGTGSELIDFIQDRVLGGVSLRGGVEEYCGGKFKVFCVADLADELNPDVRRELLYDLGCAAPLGSAAGRVATVPGPMSPSVQYYDQMMRGTVSAFRNYEALPLIDSFTVLGHGLLGGDVQRATWRETYFRIYVFNLFLKFSLHHYAANLKEDSHISLLDLRDRFETFLRFYDLGRISFNFLPELLHDGIRAALDLESELDRLRTRITRLSIRIGETQTTRTNRLLGFISWIGSLAGVGVVWTKLESVRDELGWPRVVFFGLVLLLTAAATVAALAYVFPEHRRRVVGRLRPWSRRPREQVRRGLRLLLAIRRFRRGGSKS